MKVLGIDPGVERVGWGLVDSTGSRVEYISCGCIMTSKTLSQQERLASIATQLAALIAREAPERAVVEKLFFSKNKKTALAVSEARGVILVALRQAGINTTEYTPSEVKSALAGNGRAEKRQVAWVVKNILKIKEHIRSDDALDALALALMVAK